MCTKSNQHEVGKFNRQS